MSDWDFGSGFIVCLLCLLCGITGGCLGYELMNRKYIMQYDALRLVCTANSLKQ